MVTEPESREDAVESDLTRAAKSRSHGKKRRPGQHHRRNCAASEKESKDGFRGCARGREKIQDQMEGLEEIEMPKLSLMFVTHKIVKEVVYR